MAQAEIKTYLTIHKSEETKHNGEHTTLTIPLDILSEAMRNLDNVDFKLYLYLYSNDDGDLVEYSPKKFSNTSGCHITSARKVIGKLRAAGYIVSDEDGDHFYERPHKSASNAITLN